ncbi:MAG: hypothetical protein KIT09_17890 [Bryobacteraceae bacterium]|nr:hypothetical protein [Bryobacteraceae bacterium]
MAAGDNEIDQQRHDQRLVWDSSSAAPVWQAGAVWGALDAALSEMNCFASDIRGVMETLESGAHTSPVLLRRLSHPAIDDQKPARHLLLENPRPHHDGFTRSERVRESDSFPCREFAIGVQGPKAVRRDVRQLSVN